MATAKLKKYPKSYDFVVVGLDLTSRLITLDLRRRGHSVLLLESNDSASSFSSDFSDDIYFYDALGFIENTAENSNLIEKVNHHLGTPQLNTFSQDTQIKTFESGSLKPFLGFGKKNFPSLNAYEAFNRSEWLGLAQPLKRYLEDVYQLVDEDRLSKSKLTEIEFNEGRPEAVIVNGNVRIQCDNLVLTQQPSQLLEFLPEDFLPGRLKQKIAKSKLFTTLQLTLTRPQDQNAPLEDLYFLMGGKPEDEPCLGRFYSYPEGGFESRWISFVSDELANDYSYVGGHFKYVKRQIKRAFPNLFDQPSFEKINVFNENSGFVDLSEKDKSALRSFNHLFITSPNFFPQPGLASHLFAFLDVVERLEFSQPAETPPPSEAEL